MPGDPEFQQLIKRLGSFVRELEEIADPALRVQLKGLVQCLMELNGAGFEKALEIVFEAGDAGERIIGQLGRDPLVGSLLVLYGLHPEELETRVAAALERVRPQLRKKDSEVELVGIGGGTVRLRVRAGGHVCGSTAHALQSVIEDAIYEAAPDIAGLEIEGLEGKPASGFVALGALLGSPASTAGQAEAASALHPSTALHGAAAHGAAVQGDGADG